MKEPFRSMKRGPLQMHYAVTADWMVRQKLLLAPPAKPIKKSRMAGRRRVARKAVHAKPVRSGFVDDSFGKLDYKLYFPPRLPQQKLPLLVMLHGCNQTAADFAAGTGMNKVAEEAGLLVLYPQQSLSGNLARCWNWYRPGDQRRGSGEPAAIAALTRHIVKTYNADPSRVYIAGLSAGGSAASIIGSAYPELFAAVGVHSGIPQGDVTTLGAALYAMRSGVHSVGGRGKTGAARPTIVFHGDRDIVVHPSNAAGFLIDFDLSNSARSGFARGGISGGRDFVRTEYRSETGAIMLENWNVRGSGHAWSGGSGGPFSDPTGPNASREMVRFFLGQERSVAARMVRDKVKLNSGLRRAISRSQCQPGIGPRLFLQKPQGTCKQRHLSRAERAPRYSEMGFGRE